MNTELVGKSWDKLAGKHEEVVTTFYKRFLDEYPNYKKLFPESMDHQMKKMIETMALIARVSDETEIVHPYLARVGSKHHSYHLSQEDLENFKRIFLEVVGKFCGDDWTQECQKAWMEAFDEHVIPYMMEGMEYSVRH